MSGAVNVGNGMEEESRSLGVIELKHEGTSYKPKRKLSLQARYVYGFIFFLTNLLAWLVRDYGHKILKDLPYFFSDQGYCGSEGHDCFYGESVVRVSFGCFTFFLVMFVTTFRACKLQEAYNSWHSKWWSLKFILWATSLIVSFIIPVAFIKLYGEIARIGAGVFLFLQLISVIHFLDWCDNYCMSDSESKKSCFLGLFISTICYIASFCAIVLMFVLYAPEASCALNIFFISWTLVLIKVMMIVSLHSKVNTGLLSSGIMGLYVVFLCWSVIKRISEREEWRREIRLCSSNRSKKIKMATSVATTEATAGTIRRSKASSYYYDSRDQLQQRKKQQQLTNNGNTSPTALRQQPRKRGRRRTSSRQSAVTRTANKRKGCRLSLSLSLTLATG